MLFEGVPEVAHTCQYDIRNREAIVRLDGPFPPDNSIGQK